MPILDTRREKNLLGTFISDLVLTLLSYVAENERVNIRQRQAEGIAAAKARGVHFGRAPKPLPENFYEVYQRWRMKKISLPEAAKECGMPQTTFYERARIYEKTTLPKAYHTGGKTADEIVAFIQSGESRKEQTIVKRGRKKRL